MNLLFNRHGRPRTITLWPFQFSLHKHLVIEDEHFLLPPARKIYRRDFHGVRQFAFHNGTWEYTLTIANRRAVKARKRGAFEAWMGKDGDGFNSPTEAVKTRPRF